MHRYCTTLSSHKKQLRGFFFRYFFWNISTIHCLILASYTVWQCQPPQKFNWWWKDYGSWYKILWRSSFLQGDLFSPKDTSVQDSLEIILHLNIYSIANHKANLLTISIRSGLLCHVFWATHFRLEYTTWFLPSYTSLDKSTILAKVRAGLQICVDRFHGNDGNRLCCFASDSDCIQSEGIKYVWYFEPILEQFPFVMYLLAMRSFCLRKNSRSLCDSHSASVWCLTF